MTVRERTNGCSRTSTTWSSPSVSWSRSRSRSSVARADVMVSPRNVGAYRITRLAVRQPVAAADGVARPGEPLLAEQHVRAGDPEPPLEAFERLAERLGVVRRGRLRRHQADVVVRVDPDPPGQLLVRAERLVEHAVADLLERAAGVPGLDDGRALARLDDVDREEVVVDDEDARGRQVVARGHGLAERLDPTAASPRPADGRGRRCGISGWRRPSSSRMNARLPVSRGRMRGGEHDPRSERQETRDRRTRGGR